MSTRSAVRPCTSRSGSRYAHFRGPASCPAAVRISSAYGYPAGTFPWPALYAASARRRSPCSWPRRYPMNRPYAGKASRGTNGEPLPHLSHVPGSNCAIPSAPAGEVTDGSQPDSRSICAATTGTGTPDLRDAADTSRRYLCGTAVDRPLPPAGSGTGHLSAGAAPAERAHVPVSLLLVLGIVRLGQVVQVNAERLLQP